MVGGLHVEHLGLVPYAPTVELQEERHKQVLDGVAHDTLFLLQHEPVVTIGKNGRAEHLLASAEELLRRGIDFQQTGRGGDVTYHGPGQVVGYPIVKLQPQEQDIKKYVCRLEEALIRTASDYGIDAHRVEGLRGIWVGNDKLAAIGVRISRWVTMHGYALNVSTELHDFSYIVPCGLHGRGVTSLGRLLGYAPPMDEVESRLATHTAQALGRELLAAPDLSNLQPPANAGAA